MLFNQVNCNDGMFRPLNGGAVGDEEERLVSPTFHKGNQVLEALASKFGFVYEREVGTEAVLVGRFHQAAEFGPGVIIGVISSQWQSPVAFGELQHQWG